MKIEGNLMKKIIKGDRINTIPNLLSFLRIILVPVFAVVYFANFEHHYYYAAAVLMLSGFTDVLDGIIARRYNMITSFGKILDPAADKLTQAVVAICLSINHTELVPFLVLFLAKEFSMLLGTLKLLNMGVRPSESKWWGKLSTVMIYLLFIIVLLSDIIKGVPNELIYYFMVPCAISIVFSLFNYYPIFKDLQDSEDDNGKSKNNFT